MINISGVSESRVAPAAAYYANQKDQSIIIVSTDVRAKRLASDLSFFVQDKEILTLPGEEQFLLRYCLLYTSDVYKRQLLILTSVIFILYPPFRHTLSTLTKL